MPDTAPSFATELDAAFVAFLRETRATEQRDNAYAAAILETASRHGIDIESVLKRAIYQWYGPPLPLRKEHP